MSTATKVVPLEGCTRALIIHIRLTRDQVPLVHSTTVNLAADVYTLVTLSKL